MFSTGMVAVIVSEGFLGEIELGGGVTGGVCSLCLVWFEGW